MATRVLIIDDSRPFTSAVRLRFREDPDLQIATANSVEAGLAYLRKTEVDLILLDTDLADGEKGPDHIDRFAGQRVLGMSAMSENRDLWHDAIQQGKAIGFIHKTRIMEYLEGCRADDLV